MEVCVCGGVLSVDYGVCLRSPPSAGELWLIVRVMQCFSLFDRTVKMVSLGTRSVWQFCN